MLQIQRYYSNNEGYAPNIIKKLMKSSIKQIPLDTVNQYLFPRIAFTRKCSSSQKTLMKTSSLFYQRRKERGSHTSPIRSHATAFYPLHVYPNRYEYVLIH
jgi:hypothetical protein